MWASSCYVCALYAFLCAILCSVGVSSDVYHVWNFGETAANERKILGEAPSSLFGGSVAVEGLVMAVGSPGEENACLHIDARFSRLFCTGYYSTDYGAVGAAFVYHRTNSDVTDWVEETYFVPEDGASGDLFGCAVALHGGLLLVGASHHTSKYPQTGTVYVYRRYVEIDEADGSRDISWELLDQLAPEVLMPQDYFGSAVAIHKNLTAIGAYGRDEMATQSGAVFMYYLFFNEDDEEYEFTFDEIVYVANAGSLDWMGMTVALNDNFLFAGAPGVDSNSAYRHQRTGAVYAFVHRPARNTEDGYIWLEYEMLYVEDASEDDRFGIIACYLRVLIS